MSLRVEIIQLDHLKFYLFYGSNLCSSLPAHSGSNHLFVHFLFLEAYQKNFKFYPKTKTISCLGTVRYRAQGQFLLGRLNIWRLRRNWSWVKIQIFLKMLLEMGSAELNEFCTAFIPSMRASTIKNGH